jgi:hypothetical protein
VSSIATLFVPSSALQTFVMPANCMGAMICNLYSTSEFCAAGMPFSRKYQHFIGNPDSQRFMKKNSFVVRDRKRPVLSMIVSSQV